MGSNGLPPKKTISKDAIPSSPPPPASKWPLHRISVATPMQQKYFDDLVAVGVTALACEMLNRFTKSEGVN
jgi:hypothetical protein